MNKMYYTLNLKSSHCSLNIPNSYSLKVSAIVHHYSHYIDNSNCRDIRHRFKRNIVRMSSVGLIYSLIKSYNGDPIYTYVYGNKIIVDKNNQNISFRFCDYKKRKQNLNTLICLSRVTIIIDKVRYNQLTFDVYDPDIYIGNIDTFVELNRRNYINFLEELRVNGPISFNWSKDILVTVEFTEEANYSIDEENREVLVEDNLKVICVKK